MLAREQGWPFIPEIHLFHNREKCQKFVIKRLGKSYCFHEADAQALCENGVAVVLIECESDWDTDAAMLVHEACHIVQQQCRDICESEPGDEYMAYCMQIVSQALFEAHRKWRQRHGK